MNRFRQILSRPWKPWPARKSEPINPRLALSALAIVFLTAITGLAAEPPHATVPVQSVATSQPESTTPLAKLIEALSSPQFTTREEATYTLLRLPTNQRPDVEAALARTTDAEAVARLTRVALHLFLKAQTSMEGTAALLGIAPNIEPVRLGKNNGDLRMSVAVGETQLGFPAAEQLRCGDRILAINGRNFTLDLTFEEFRQRINTQTPGTTLTFTVLRGGRQIVVPVRLVGLTEEQVSDITQYVHRRNEAAQAYLAALRTGETPSARLEIKDDSPNLPKWGSDRHFTEP